MLNGGTLEQAKAAEESMLAELDLLLPIGALTLGSVVAVVLTIALSRGRGGWIAAWTGFAHLASAGLAVYVWLGPGPAEVMGGLLNVDGLALTLIGILGVAGALCIAISRPAVAGSDREGEYYAMLTFASLAAAMLGMAGDAALLGLTIGALGLATFVMTGYSRASARANEGSIKYYIFCTVPGATMLYGLTWWFGLAGTTDLGAIGTAMAEASTAVVVGSTALVLFGLGYKVAAVPFHFWTPDAYDGAPIPVAAYLSVLPKLAGLVALARVLDTALPADLVGWSTAVAVLAAATMTLGNLAALPQTNVIRLLAYSSIAQSGYLLMGVAALQGSDQGLPALVFYAIAYGAMNIAAFAVVVAVARERGGPELGAFRGLGRAHPAWAAVLVLSFLSLIGIPPLAGFVGKLELFKAAIDADQAWLAVVAVVNTVISIYYYLRVLAPAVLEEDEGWAPPPAEPAPAGRLPVAVVIGLSGAATVAIGVAAEPVLRLSEAATMLG